MLFSYFLPTFHIFYSIDCTTWCGFHHNTYIRAYIWGWTQASLMSKNYLPGSYLLFGFHDPAGLPLFLHSGFLPLAPHLAPNLLGCCLWSHHVPEFVMLVLWPQSADSASVGRLILSSLIYCEHSCATPLPHHCLGWTGCVSLLFLFLSPGQLFMK